MGKWSVGSDLQKDGEVFEFRISLLRKFPGNAFEFGISYPPFNIILSGHTLWYTNILNINENRSNVDMEVLELWLKMDQ